MSYYDIDAILTDAQKVPCTFTLDLPPLPTLSPDPISASTPHPLPLWLAEPLAIQRLPSSSSSNMSSSTDNMILAIDIPSPFAPHVLNALIADPTAVHLRALSPVYFALAARFLELFDEGRIGGVVEGAFRKRAVGIADQAGGGGRDGSEFLSGLDEWERGLFRAAHDGAKAVRVWMGAVRRG